MKRELPILLSFVLLFATITAAHAVPITYAFTSPSDFTLGGTQYTGFYRITFYGDTDNVITNDTQITNSQGRAVLSSFGHDLATISVPTQFVYDSTYQTAALISEYSGEPFFYLVIGSYNGMTYTRASQTGVVPLSTFSTSAGEFDITRLGEVVSFEAVPAPEPSTVLLVATGATSLLAGLKRRRKIV